MRRLPARARRKASVKPLLPREVDDKLMPPAWRKAVYANPDLPQGGPMPGSARLHWSACRCCGGLPGAEHLARPGGGEVGIHGDDTVDALAEAHDHRDETRFRTWRPTFAPGSTTAA